MQNITASLLGTFASRIHNAPFIAMEASLVGQSSECLARLPEYLSPLLVCDENTYRILGMRVASELSLSHDRICILSADVSADYEAVKTLLAKPCDVILAVGAGTVNDICKLAAFEKQIPYAVFPTAPSMNGYVSANASISEHGFKSTRKARMPVAVFCDLDVIRNAPYRLIRSGIGDVLCRCTSQADWLLSHLLFNTTYDAAPFTLVAPFESAIIAQAEHFSKRDAAAISTLMKALLVGGFAMVMCGGSYPASQGEHMLAHTMEMLFPDMAKNTYHGEQIAVCTLEMESIQRRVINGGGTFLFSDNHEKYLNELPASLTAFAKNELQHKYSKDALTRLKSLTAAEWKQIFLQIRQTLHSEGALKSVLLTAGCPTNIVDLDWQNDAYETAKAQAYLLRSRFTFLDLHVAV